jgi:hypothetical protein
MNDALHRRALVRANSVDMATADRHAAVAGGYVLPRNEIAHEISLADLDLTVLVGEEDRDGGAV